MNSIKLFESKKVRTQEKELWFFSVIDVIEILSGSNNPSRYSSDLKRKLEQEGFSQFYDNTLQLKMESIDGKKYLTDCTDTQGLLGISRQYLRPKQNLSNNGCPKSDMNEWIRLISFHRIYRKQST